MDDYDYLEKTFWQNVIPTQFNLNMMTESKRKWFLPTILTLTLTITGLVND